MMSNNNKTLVIYGCGGHARSIADVAQKSCYQSILFVDDHAKENEIILGHIVTTDFPDFPFDVIIGIGDNQKRASAFHLLQAQHLNVITLLANDAYLGKDAVLEKGVFVACGVHIGPNALIKANTILNTHAIIEHEVKIGEHCHISINAIIAGKCQIGDFVMMGAGATVIDNIRICSNVSIGAGAVVVDHINEPGTYLGVPARRKETSGLK